MQRGRESDVKLQRHRYCYKKSKIVISAKKEKTTNVRRENRKRVYSRYCDERFSVRRSAGIDHLVPKTDKT